MHLQVSMFHLTTMGEQLCASLNSTFHSHWNSRFSLKLLQHDVIIFVEHVTSFLLMLFNVCHPSSPHLHLRVRLLEIKRLVPKKILSSPEHRWPKNYNCNILLPILKVIEFARTRSRIRTHYIHLHLCTQSESLRNSTNLREWPVWDWLLNAKGTKIHVHPLYVRLAI